MTRKLLEIAADIVQAQSSVFEMSPDDLELALAKTFITLQKMQKAEEEGSVLALARTSDMFGPEEGAEKSDPKGSIQEDKIVCLECGAEMRQLTAKHLGSHELTPREYKKKWGFPLKQPLSAKALTKARSKAAKKRGLPESLVRYQEERKQRREEVVPADQAPVAEQKPAVKRNRKKKGE